MRLNYQTIWPRLDRFFPPTWEWGIVKLPVSFLKGKLEHCLLLAYLSSTGPALR